MVTIITPYRWAVPAHGVELPRPAADYNYESRPSRRNVIGRSACARKKHEADLADIWNPARGDQAMPSRACAAKASAFGAARVRDRTAPPDARSGAGSVRRRARC